MNLKLVFCFSAVFLVITNVEGKCGPQVSLKTINKNFLFIEKKFKFLKFFSETDCE